jgi:hypothetical protein
MKKAPIRRIAFVKLTENGTSYPMRCDRLDILSDDRVHVICRFRNQREVCDYGIVTSITYQRWNCQSEVEMLASEASYELLERDFL